MNSNKTATKKPANKKKFYLNKSKSYWWNHVRTYNIEHTDLTCHYPKEGHQVGATLIIGREEMEITARKIKPMNLMEVKETLLRRI